jgi:hypothetical protein
MALGDGFGATLLMGWTAPDGIKKVPNWCRVEPGKGAVREES